jgi:glycine hydroxymethyltransferase
LVLVDVSGLGLTGRQAERALRDCGLTLNRNTVPKDPNGAWYTSGLRLGTPAVTTLGMGPSEMREIAEIFALVLKNVSPVAGSKAKFLLEKGAQREAGERVAGLISRYPVYPEIDLSFLENYFGQDSSAEEARLGSSLAKA